MPYLWFFFFFFWKENQKNKQKKIDNTPRVIPHVSRGYHITTNTLYIQKNTLNVQLTTDSQRTCPWDMRCMKRTDAGLNNPGRLRSTSWVSVFVSHRVFLKLYIKNAFVTTCVSHGGEEGVDEKLSADGRCRRLWQKVGFRAFLVLHHQRRSNSWRENLKSQSRLVCCKSATIYWRNALLSLAGGGVRKCTSAAYQTESGGEGGEKDRGERRVCRLLSVNDGCRKESWKPDETGWLNYLIRAQWALHLSDPWKEFERKTAAARR